MPEGVVNPASVVGKDATTGLPTPTEQTGGALHVHVSNDALALRLVGVPVLVADEAANDSDKTLTAVPALVTWEIQSIRVEFIATATVGNRQLTVRVQDDVSDIVFEVTPGIVQTANQNIQYHFAPHLPDLTAGRDAGAHMLTPFPNLILLAGYTVRVFDNNAVDATADDMVVQMLVMQRVEI